MTYIAFYRQKDDKIYDYKYFNLIFRTFWINYREYNIVIKTFRYHSA